MTKAPIRVANFSGALGDYVGAFADAIADETIDVAIGDYLAEMTMGRVAEGFCAAGKPEALAGYHADVFLRQITPELGRIAARAVKVVTNAGAFNPAGLAGRIAQEAAAQGLALRVAYVEGDDLLARVPALAAEGQLANLDDGKAIGSIADRLLAANAYLGGWGIVAALEQGADIVICGRVSDASLVLGPAAWWHGWAKDDWDALAGSVAAGHVIECGPQAVGGNFSGFAQLGNPARLGFPIAEIAADGSSVITKRTGDAGAGRCRFVGHLPLHGKVPGGGRGHDLGQALVGLYQVHGHAGVRIVEVVVERGVHEDPLIEVVGPDFGDLVSVGVFGGDVDPSGGVTHGQACGYEGEVAEQAVALAAGHVVRAQQERVAVLSRFQLWQIVVAPAVRVQAVDGHAVGPVHQPELGLELGGRPVDEGVQLEAPAHRGQAGEVLVDVFDRRADDAAVVEALDPAELVSRG